MSLSWRRSTLRFASAFVLLLLGNMRGAAQETTKSCSGGFKIALRATYAGPWITGKASRVSLEYGMSSPISASAAWIEIWDGPDRLFQQSVKVQSHGELVWGGLRDVPDTPPNLQLAILVPEFDVPCTEDCRTTSSNRKVSTVLAGTAPDEDPPTPSLTPEIVRLVEGDQWSELVVEGMLFGSPTKILLQEQTADERWVAREYLPADLVDLHHVRVQIPQAYLRRPAVLGLAAAQPDYEEAPGSEVRPPQQTLYVVSKDSPILSSVEPSEVDSDEVEEGGGLTVRLRGSGFTPGSRVAMSLENARGLAHGGLKPVFISNDELRVHLPAERLVIDHKWSASRPIRLWVGNDDVFHISEAQEVRVSESVHFPHHPSGDPVASITHISPYPVPLIDSGASVLLTVRGENFAPGESVLADNSDKEVKLKTVYVSPQELRAWLPRSVWRERRLRFRLVAQTAAGRCTADVWEDDN